MSRRRSTPRPLRFEPLEPRAMLAAFTPGDVVVYRVGTGSGSLVNTGNPVFLDEYSPSGVFVQSIALPATGSGGKLVASGTATSEGQLTRSVDGQFVVLTGYSATTGGGSALKSSSAARSVARVDGTGAIDLTTLLSDFATSDNPRAVVSTNGTDLWMAGGAGGVRYATLGSSTSTQLSTTIVDARDLQVFGGQLYVSSQGTTIGVGTVGTGLPTTSGKTITNLSGIPTSGSAAAVFFARLAGPGTSPDTLYIADETSGSGGAILKYSFNGTTWQAKGSIAAAGVRGLTGAINGSSVTLFATTGSGTATGGGTLYKFTDSTGAGATVSGTATALQVLSASSNEAFRGVAFVPEHLPVLATNATLSLGNGATGTIGNSLLQTVDTDNTASQLLYYLGTVPTHGSLRKNGVALIVGGTFTQADVDQGLLSYTHDASATTSDGFTFSVSDGASGSVGWTTFSINIIAGALPTLVTNAGLTVNEAGSGTIGTAVLQTTDTDSTPGQLTYTLNTAPAHGSVLKNSSPLAAGGMFTQLDIDNGIVSYTHDGSETTSDGFTFTARDNTGNALGSTAFAITVSALNDAPVNSVPGSQTLTQNASKSFSTAAGNAVQVSDADVGSGSLQVTLSVGHGTLTLSTTTGLAFSGGGNGQASLTFTGTLANVNAALDGLQFTPTTGYSGGDTLTITTNDQGNSGGGGAKSDSDSVALTIQAVPFVLLNEIKANPPGHVTGGDKYQFVELRGTPSLNLANVYFVQFDGNAGSTLGRATFVEPLAGFSLGTNGLLMIKSPTGGHTAAAGTTVVTDAQIDQAGGALSKSTVAFYVFFSAGGFVEGTDYDTNNDGTLDNLPSGAIALDNVGWSDGDTGDHVYGGVALSQSAGTPDAATRYNENSSTSAAAWYNGDLYDLGGVGGQGDPIEVLYDITRTSAVFPSSPSVPSLTPGATNFDEPPQLTGGGGSTSYTENGPPQPIAANLALADADNTLLASATIQISSNYAAGQDSLSFTNTGSITSSFNAASGTLTLSGSDTLANYQSALGSVAYVNSSDAPSTANRTVTFTVSDGLLSSSSVSQVLTVVAVDDAPVNNVPLGIQNVARGGSLTFSAANGNALTVADVDASTVQVTLAATNGTVSLAGTAGLTVSGNGTASLTATGSLTNINAALAGLTFSPNTASGSATLQLTTNDQGNSGTGGPLTDMDTVAINVVAPPSVQSVVVGNGTSQRSIVAGTTITFTGLVTIDAAAFTLARLATGGALLGTVNVNTTVSTVAGNTTVALSFSGAGTEGAGSLVDGNYRLTLLGNKVHETVLGIDLDGDGDGNAGGDRVDSFFRLFGDSDGDRDVDNLDYARMRSAFNTISGQAGYLAYFNFDGDSDVDNLDYARFRTRYGTQLIA